MVLQADGGGCLPPTLSRAEGNTLEAADGAEKNSPPSHCRLQGDEHVHSAQQTFVQADAGELVRTAASEGWGLHGGVGVIPGVPAGPWTLQVVAADGRLWQQAVVTERGRVEVSLE